MIALQLFRIYPNVFGLSDIILEIQHKIADFQSVNKCLPTNLKLSPDKAMKLFAAVNLMPSRISDVSFLCEKLEKDFGLKDVSVCHDEFPQFLEVY